MADTTTPKDTMSRAELEAYYEKSAQDYLRRLTQEHFMEATPQATQRKITLESLDLVHAKRPEVQLFNELLVQYPRPGHRRQGQVVPDNMVVVCEESIKAVGSLDLDVQPAGPYWVLEYVSKNSVRKDYDDNFDKYQNELRVPYYLIFYPETQDLTLYRHTGEKYASVPPNGQGRHPLPELELEVAILDGWVRFWFRGELLPLPAELQRDLDETRERLADTEQEVQQERRRAEQEKLRAEQEKLRAEQERQRTDEAVRRAEAAEREVELLRAQLRQAQSPPGT